MADDWLGISSTELNSFCDEQDAYKLVDALDGLNSWACLDSDHSGQPHWFVLDLEQTHTIKKVRGRSYGTRDPIDVNIYIDDNNPPTTLCKEGISTWQDNANWVEITLTSEGTGRYIKVEIEEHELATYLEFGDRPPNSFPIFDAYGDVAAPPPAVVVGDLQLRLGCGPGAGGRIPHADMGIGLQRHPRSRVH